LLISALIGATASGYFNLVAVPSSSFWAISIGPFLVVACAIIVSQLTHRRRTTSQGDSEGLCRRALQCTVIGMVSFALIAACFAGVASGVTAEYWSPLPIWAVVATLLLGLLVPLPILVGLVYTVPRFMESNPPTPIISIDAFPTQSAGAGPHPFAGSQADRPGDEPGDGHAKTRRGSARPWV
jgi:hypothetical protein